MDEMERMLTDYQEKLESVTTNYEEKVHILEKRLVDNEMEHSPERDHSRRDSGGHHGKKYSHVYKFHISNFFINLIMLFLNHLICIIALF